MARSKSKKKLLDLVNVRDFINNVGGKRADELIDICIKKNEPVNDEEISEKLKMKVTQIRTILNSLHYRGVTHYTKTKNKDSGWYSYKWTVNEQRIAELILEKNLEELEKLDTKINYEQNYMYFECTKQCGKLQFEIAAEYEFKCPNCGETMNSIDNQIEINENKKKIEVLKEDTEELKKMLNVQ